MYSFGSTISNTSEYFNFMLAATTMAEESSLVLNETGDAGSKRVCAFCDVTFQQNVEKSESEKCLEVIAKDYFNRRVLRAEEVSLNETGTIVDDAGRCCHILNSVVLCSECISRFCKNEANILKDQMEYLDKMKGPRDFDQVLADPWLDLKRYAYAKLKNQQNISSEKLRLIENSEFSQTDKTKGESATSTASSSAHSLPVDNIQGKFTSSTPIVNTVQQVLVRPIGMDYQMSSEAGSVILNNGFSESCQLSIASDSSDRTTSPPPNLKFANPIAVRPKRGNVDLHTESAREDTGGESEGGYSVCSVPPNTRSKKTLARKNLKDIEKPSTKRPKLCLPVSQQTVKSSPAKALEPPMIYARKSAPPSPTSPSAPNMDLDDIQQPTEPLIQESNKDENTPSLPSGAPKTKTPKDNPMNKASSKAQRTKEKSEEKKEENKTPKKKPTTKTKLNDKTAQTQPAAKVKMIGGRLLNDNSGSSDEPDSSSESSSESD